MCALADLSSRLDALLRAPLASRIEQLDEIAARCAPKDLQGALPPLVMSIFGVDGRTPWGLRTGAIEADVRDARLLFEFLAPNGTLFKICYKLIADPQLKYAFPVRLLPADTVQTLESGRIPQFYLDLLNIDPHTRQIISLNLNPFDYYIFHFAVHLYCTSYTRDTWDARNSVYYQLACEYLLHFLPDDINKQVLPHIGYFTGKTPALSPMQVSNRHTQFHPLLISLDNASCAVVSGSGGTQYHPRGEVWRSETVLQVFIDVWLSTASQNDSNMINGSMCASRCAYPACEHVRIARSLIKQCHAFSLCGPGDPTSLGELRRATAAVLAPRAHAHIRHLMHTWPLDSSFKLVLELWFSFIQPWRYANMGERQNRSDGFMNSSNEANQRPARIDNSFIPFISENLLAYTEIFQLVVPRFLRLNLCVPKNAVMLFRLTKVFSQSNLVQLLMDVENSVANEFESTSDPVTSNSFLAPNNLSESLLTPNKSGSSLDSRCGHPSYHQQTSHINSGWELNEGSEAAPQNQYRPLLLGGGRNMARDLLIYALHAHSESMEILKTRELQINSQDKDFLSSCYYWLFGDNSNYDNSIAEIKKVPVYLSTAISQLAEIFSLDANITISNYATSQNFPSVSYQKSKNNMNVLLSPKMARERTKQIKYMGDPELQPVKTYENGFLVRVLQQLCFKINESYQNDMKLLWGRRDIIGILTREVLSPPCTIHTYTKNGIHDGELIARNLPPRLSLRYFASNKFLFWFIIFFSVSYSLGYGSVSFLLFNIIGWTLLIFFKGIFKWLFGNVNQTEPDQDSIAFNLSNRTDTM